MSTALITGISGQTGSYLSEQLAAEQWHVVGLVRGGDTAAASVEERVPGVRLVEGDLADADGLKRIVADVAPDVIFNLGGLTSVAQSWKDPIATAEITGMSVSVLLDAALRSQESVGRPVHFVQASSAEMFGLPTVSPQIESTPIAPRNPYGAAKAYGHFLVASYRELGLSASSVILYNHESPRRPESFVTRKITNGVARIATGKQDRLVLGSLDARRDWGWAPDYARAIDLVGRADADDFVVATGEAHAVSDFVAAAFAAVGIDDWQSYVEQDPRFMRPADPAELVGDSSKIRSKLGWQPSMGFAEIVAAMVENDLALERNVA